MTNWNTQPFEFGSAWIRADFHLHTKADKEFDYTDSENNFCTAYINQLKEKNIRLGVITNHNKCDIDEFKAIKKKARSEGIYFLPGIELSVSDGANGIHVLVVFSEEWIEEGKDYINQFLNVAFAGRTSDQYENENSRSNNDIITTLQKLKEYDRNFFIIFAHVESASGLWKEISGGRMSELAKEPLINEYCLGFQKVRTHDKADQVCRIKVKKWWDNSYPAELEGSDPKKIDQIGRGESCYLKIGDFNFEAIQYALRDHQVRCSNRSSERKHSYIKSIKFEGGIFNGEKISFTAGLNCLIGIRGSGKSSILESIRYALDIQFGQKSQDTQYKQKLYPLHFKMRTKANAEFESCL